MLILELQRLPALLPPSPRPDSNMARELDGSEEFLPPSQAHRLAQCVFSSISEYGIRLSTKKRTKHYPANQKAGPDFRDAIDWNRVAELFNRDHPDPLTPIQMAFHWEQILAEALNAPGMHGDEPEQMCFRPIGGLKGRSLDGLCVEGSLCVVDEDPEDPEHFRLESLEPKLSLKQSHSLLLMAASHGEHFPAAFQLLTGYRGSDVILRTHFQHLIQAIVNGDFSEEDKVGRAMLTAYNQICEKQPKFGFPHIQLKS